MNIIDMRGELNGKFGLRSLSAVRYTTIHHSGDNLNLSPSLEEACRAIRNYHVNTRGWSGIGYHYVILRGQIAYVGDIRTSRANVLNMNDVVVGICILGNYSHSTPADMDIAACRDLIADIRRQLPRPIEVKGHKELNPGHTVCPGDKWEEWRKRLEGGTVDEFNEERFMLFWVATGVLWNPEAGIQNKAKEMIKSGAKLSPPLTGEFTDPIDKNLVSQYGANWRATWHRDTGKIDFKTWGS